MRHNFFPPNIIDQSGIKKKKKIKKLVLNIYRNVKFLNGKIQKFNCAILENDKINNYGLLKYIINYIYKKRH